ncbi:MAG: hypothetical protein GXY59_07385 [Bacteroidales bacterium]|nr:hypothetical protein [Bacteroidales bacterium]
MRRIISFLAVALWMVHGFAQSPDRISYQAVIRNSNSTLVTNTTIGMQISVLQDSTSGTAVYVETQIPTTNANGLITLQIGSGVTVSGHLSSIDWAAGPYFLKTETDLTGGTNYTITGTSQLLSVPYALYAQTAETVSAPLMARIEALEYSDLLNHGFTDSRDENHYGAVKIGHQIWMAENLKYLPFVVGPDSASSTSPFYYVYGYDSTSVAEAKTTAEYTTYGVLYNWAAAMDGAKSGSGNPSGVQGVCPVGWHLPSVAEWLELIDFLGGQLIAGDMLKESGTAHWISPNLNATNETGFSGLPGGHREVGTFSNMGKYGSFWTATEANASRAWFRCLHNYDGNFGTDNYLKEFGYSIRCIRD